jgi:hypothetical protein
MSQTGHVRPGRPWIWMASMVSASGTSTVPMTERLPTIPAAGGLG